ncbi:MAG: hypothetical protein H6730_02095 [Deltaproteobacteria bacterium]|nr:hypothetical protein [Deltaproteobacteria bacterium]
MDGEPTRVARIGDRVLVSLRTNGSILELRDDGGALSKVREVPVGTEPVGLVATEDGTRVYAAISTAGQVLELDGVSLATLRVWNVPGEPKWLGLHPGGEALYVSGTGNPGLFYINLVTGASRAISVPVPEGFSNRGEALTLSMRLTGDPAVSPKGNLLAVPVMFVDNTTPFAESSTVAPPPDDGYGGRMNPGMTLVPVDGQGLPKDEEARSVAISTFEVNGYPASALFSPDGELVVATIEGSAAIALFDPRKSPSDGFPIEPRGSVLEPQPTDFIQTPAGPRAVAFTADRMASVFSFIDGVVTRIDVSDTKDQLDQGGSFIRRSGMSFGDVSVVSQPLPADVAAGRRLFYASNDTRMSSEHERRQLRHLPRRGPRRRAHVGLRARAAADPIPRRGGVHAGAGPVGGRHADGGGRRAGHQPGADGRQRPGAHRRPADRGVHRLRARGGPPRAPRGPDPGRSRQGDLRAERRRLRRLPQRAALHRQGPVQHVRVPGGEDAEPAGGRDHRAVPARRLLGHPA